MRNYITILTLLFFFPICLLGQQDSIVLLPNQLQLIDINDPETAESKQKIFIATRSLQNVEDLPFTIKIITKDEIRENGYRTLVDALRMQPGIRISQPGSALEGEMSKVRGYSGNSNMKIFLNGFPIKPLGVKGMPIGAQLPIQQAERIEIIYGAMGTIHSDNASAGVINIVLEESQRPVYTQANLSIGSNEFANLDISFGGRLGKRKRTLRYSLYGNYTSRADTKVRHSNDSIFNPLRYPSRIIDSFNVQNYISINDQPLINELPHQSGMIGLDLAYRGMKFSFQAMNRRDHSAIGFSPTAISYTNPTNYLGERIINANFSVGQNWKRFGIEYRIQYLQNRMDNQSSTDYVNNLSSKLLDTLSHNESFNPITQIFDDYKYDSLSRSHLTRYFNDTRFSYSESNDLRTELIFNLFLWKNIGLKFGGRINGFSNFPFYTYSRVPLGNRFRDILQQGFHQPSNTLLSPFNGNNYIGFQFSSFIHMDASWKKLFFVGQVQWINYDEDAISTISFDQPEVDISEKAFTHNLGVNYKFNNNWSIKINHSSAVRFHSPYYKANSFHITILGDPPFFDDDTPISRAITITEPERTTNFEIGVKSVPHKTLSFEASGFITNTTNRMTYGIQRNFFTNDPTSVTHGYFSSGINTIWYGLQSEYVVKYEALDFIFNIALTYDRTTDNIPTGFSENIGLTETPRMMRKTRIVLRPTKRISFTFDNIFMGKAPNRVVGRSELNSFRILDVLVNYKINRNFRIFFKTRNLFNRESAGVNAVGNWDDLIYNPQELRNFRVGMSYRVD